jgi:hypothetical protein
MRMPRRFGTAHAIAHREVTVITAMMYDLRRIVEILDCDVAAEEERARVFDKSDPLYPILARTLAARRDNLKLTVAALGQRLREIDAAAAQGVATAA